MTVSKESGKPADSSIRVTPGSTGEGDYFHVTLRDSRLFVRFRTQDVGAKGGLQRVVGQRPNETWADQKWLISKKMAHVENGYLVADDEAARKLLRQFGSAPRHIEGDLFKARPVRRLPRVRH